jgi:hypothetical protein
VKRVVTLWSSERGLSAMLVFLCLGLFVGIPMSLTLHVGQVVFAVLFSLILISGAVGITGRPTLAAVVGVLTIATLVLRWASVENPASLLRVWSQALSIVVLSVFAALVLVQVFRDGPITPYRIQGAIIVYLLIGLTWSEAYELLFHVVPGAFNFAQVPKAGAEESGLTYFSFVTLTTLGYGDITPLHPTARSLVIAEALLGQLYPSILIARLVSMELESRRSK